MGNLFAGSCHCKAVEFEVELANGIENVVRCNCSYCRKRSAYMVGVALKYFKVTKGKQNLTRYQWGTQEARHYFCRHCGIYTHHQRRSNANQYGFNIACIEGVDPYSFVDAPISDGANHPKDR